MLQEKHEVIFYNRTLVARVRRGKTVRAPLKFGFRLPEQLVNTHRSLQLLPQHGQGRYV